VQGAPAELGTAVRGGVGGPLEDAAGTWNRILADFTGMGQVLLGITVLGVGLLVVVSQTRAGAAVGGAAARGAASGVRRGLRFIPGVGALA
jgi:hypothetical protein